MLLSLPLDVVGIVSQFLDRREVALLCKVSDGVRGVVFVRWRASCILTTQFLTTIFGWRRCLPDVEFTVRDPWVQHCNESGAPLVGHAHQTIINHLTEQAVCLYQVGQDVVVDVVQFHTTTRGLEPLRLYCKMRLNHRPTLLELLSRRKSMWPRDLC